LAGLLVLLVQKTGQLFDRPGGGWQDHITPFLLWLAGLILRGLGVHGLPTYSPLPLPPFVMNFFFFSISYETQSYPYTSNTVTNIFSSLPMYVDPHTPETADHMLTTMTVA